MGQRITQLDLAGPLTGSEYFPVVQEGKTKKVQATSFTPLLSSSCQCTLVSRWNTVGTDANTLEKYLQTYQLPPSALKTDGSWIEIIAWGSLAANNNGKNIYLRFGSTLFDGGGTIGSSSANNKTWCYRALVGRVTQVSQKIYARALADPLTGNFGSASPTSQGESFLVGAEDLAVSVPIALSAQNAVANANDIVCEGFIIELHQIDVNS